MSFLGGRKWRGEGEGRTAAQPNSNFSISKYFFLSSVLQLRAGILSFQHVILLHCTTMWCIEMSVSPKNWKLCHTTVFS